MHAHRVTYVVYIRVGIIVKKYTNDCKFIIKMHDLIIYIEMTIYKKLNSRMFKSQSNSFYYFNAFIIPAEVARYQ